MKGTADILSGLHSLKTADEHFLSFLREHPDARIERMVTGYVKKIEWIAKDLCACPFFTEKMVDALKEEWNSDTFTVPAIHEKILRLSPQKREELDIYIDNLLKR